MNGRLRVVVADDEEDMRAYFTAVLAGLGHEVAAVAETGSGLVDACARCQPDLVIADIRMPDCDGLDAIATVCSRRPVPVVLVSGYCDESLIRRAEEQQVMAYLTKPVKQADLAPAIALAVRRFEQFQALSRETADLRQALEDRKLVERAKGILMRRAGLAEDDAFRRLQRLACERNTKLAQIARMICTAEEALRPPGN